MITKMNPDVFDYTLYDSGAWANFEIDFRTSLNNEDLLVKCLQKSAIGYCDGISIKVRPKSNTYAVMFNMDGETCWWHVRKDLLIKAFNFDTKLLS